MPFSVLEMPAGIIPSPVAAPQSTSEVRLRARSAPLYERSAPQPGNDQLMWDVFNQSRRVGHVGLDFSAGEFSGVPTHQCPALRIFISPGHRGYGYAKAAGQALLDILRQSNFSRALQACHTENDASGAAVLSACGFLYTGCRSTRADGRVQKHMIAVL